MISAGLIKELREKTGAGMLDCKNALQATDGNIEKAVDWLREKGILKAANKSERIAAEGITNVLINDNKGLIIELNCETDFVAKTNEFQELVKTIASTVIEKDSKTVEEALELAVKNQTINSLIIEKTAKTGEKLNFRRFKIIIKENSECFGSYIHMGGKIAVLTLIDNDNQEVAKDIAMHIAAMKPIYIRKEDVSKEEQAKESAILKEQAINEGKTPEIAEKMVQGRIGKYFKEICLEEQSFVKNQDLTVLEYLKQNSTKIIKFIRYEVGEGMEKREDNFVDEVMNQIKKD